ncbi:MAG: hypothetical protein ACE5FI_02200 [Anaerolineales bacterium]
MTVDQLLAALHRERARRAYIQRLNILDHSLNLLRARLYISDELFVQVYRNDRFKTTNLVLIYSDERVYARDQLDGKWHRHPSDSPEQHDTSPEGRRAVELSEFLDEVETVLAAMDLP